MVKTNFWKSPKTKSIFTNYIEFLNKKSLHKYKNYQQLHKWSVENKDLFWQSIWDFTKIKGKLIKPILKNKKNFLKSEFFYNSKINFTENILKKNNNDEAIVFYSEKNKRRKITWNQLEKKINIFSNYLLKIGIKKGDRVAAVLPNIPETVISFLSVAKIGAIWSSCSSDFGSKAVIDRFGQINPKILIVTDYYFYNNNKINTLKDVKEIKSKIKSIKEVIIIPFNLSKKKYNINFKYKNWLSIINRKEVKNDFKEFKFNLPLYILYSSGTTGIPKCIVHGAGGSLIQHKKEHQIHCDIRPNDKVFYYTTCGWMMWNWLISALSSSATIYLYDGSPFYPNHEKLFKIINKEKITFFGAGAKLFDELKKKNINFKKKFKFKNLKTIASTGSPLLNETYEYIYKKIKKNIHLTSISGGTEIVSCFVCGNPNEKVNIGEIQCKGLGMDVAIFDNRGKEIKNKKGELVCKTSFPSKPLCFWNDKNNIKFKNTYFKTYKNIWKHGDYAKITKNNGFIIYGRSDSTLNSGGVRIGTSEIYRVVDNIKEIIESIIAEQIIKSDTRVILFLKLKKNIKLNDLLKIKIKNLIKKSLSPKHVPSLIYQVNDIPKTKSGKIVELTVKKIINKEKINNVSSLQNPKSLEDFKKISSSL